MNRILLRGPALAAPLLAVAVLAVAPAAQAKTVFVEPLAGQDANAGTAAKPLRTLAKALSRAHAGDTVVLAAGTYSAGTNGERYTDAFRDVFTPAGVTIQG